MWNNAIYNSVAYFLDCLCFCCYKRKKNYAALMNDTTVSDASPLSRESMIQISAHQYYGSIGNYPVTVVSIHDTPNYTPLMVPDSTENLNKQAKQIIERLFQNFNQRDLTLSRVKTDVLQLLTSTLEAKANKSADLSTDINLMIKSAEEGNWDEVFRILGYRPYIINCIPSGSAWSVLHYAAWHYRYEVTSKLLRLPHCNPQITSKSLPNKVFNSGGSKADEVYRVRINPDIEKSINNAYTKVVINNLIPSMMLIQKESDIEVRVIFIVLACFHKSLIPEVIKKRDTLKIYTLMQKVFRFIDCESNWKLTRQEVARQLQTADLAKAKYLATGNENGDIDGDNEESKEDFYSRVISMLTHDTLHYDMSKPLFYYRNGNYVTLPRNLALAALGILQNAILLNWKELKTTTAAITYHEILLPDKERQMYMKGAKIAWLSYVSCSVKRIEEPNVNATNEECIFIISNSKFSRWKPRNLYSHITYRQRENYMYPVGTMCKVTSVVDENPTKIYLKLQN